MADAGRVLLLGKGDYNSGTTYNVLDWVRYGGASWVCAVDGTVGVTPTVSSSNWKKMTEDGDSGSQWYTGTGVTGTSTTPTVFSGSGVTNARPNDIYMNTSSQTVYHCVTGGGPTVATWMYDFTISGGGGGGSYSAGTGITITSNVISIDPGTIASGNNKPVTGDTVNTALGNKADNTSSYTVASSRTNIASGDTIPTILGKIQKWFADLADLAFISKGSGSAKFLREDGTWETNNSANNVTVTVKRNGTSQGTFNTNQSSASDIDIDDDEFITPSITQANGKVTFDNLDPNYGYDLYFDDSNVTYPADITIPTWGGTYKKEAGTNTGTIKLTYTITGGTDGTSKWTLRILK